MTQPVGLIGIGLMGSVLARRLIDAGYRVIGTDIDPARRDALHKLGGEPVDSVTEISRDCRCVLLAVLAVAQVEDVVEGPHGLLANMPSGAERMIALCTATCEPDRLAALAARAQLRGLALIDAPVSGTSQQVLRGDGLGLIGGDSAAIRAVDGIIRTIYPRSYRVGDAGAATSTKLAINLILGLNRVALAEGLVFAERLGLDKASFLKIARDSAAYSQIMDVKGDKMVAADYTPVSKVSQHLKDVRIMLDEANRRGQPLALASALADILEGCMRHGEGERDNAIMIEEIRRRGTA